MISRGWKSFKISTRPACPYLFVNTIIYIGNSQNSTCPAA